MDLILYSQIIIMIYVCLCNKPLMVLIFVKVFYIANLLNKQPHIL